MKPKLTLGAAFGEVVRSRRAKLKISQEKLAELTDLHRTYISQIERGIKSPTLKSFVALAKALQMKPYELMAETEHTLEASK